MDVAEEDGDARLALEQWQRKVESSLFLIMRMMHHHVDTELVRMRRETSIAASIPSAIVIRDGLRDWQRQDGLQVFLKKNELDSMARNIMPFCDAVLGQRVGSSKQLILNRIECSLGANVEIMKKDVRDLGRKLRHRTPQTFGLLTCKDKDSYRHPNRQGRTPRKDYIMQHDIFSLGVCLLEIGLWRSFVSYDSDCGHPIPLEGLGLIRDAVRVESEATLKEKLMEMAHNELPAYMGPRFYSAAATKAKVPTKRLDECMVNEGQEPLKETSDRG
ncbi:uncharacterized protein NECHADRAFT_82257 [Fusarium vanettenii 77-13-4]|uniref:Uncharacterized protein n=1 Tax=Fusarium vanettenii (strain ATCC MYA-4622 / CBS 123669 / FGSC 9596 / NRRL 45880 / 77-13-4) TaxID=660122 RepID=C7ZNJ7_FUSV7|nr:uncharacterized protein NECHADRAFT_82257 [Fusarium vanettenii 77-13-4]EEU34409.1 hypothetical protein NECHADRAFT_82257 [Fusarium vanettenii 77-13-4]